MEDIHKFRPWRDWAQAGSGGALLPTASAVEWFMRRHRQRLITEGVLLPRRGPGGSLIDLERFGDVALRIVREAA